MSKLHRRLAIAAASATFVMGLVTDRAQAYEFFTNRDEWLTAVQGQQLSLENFNSIPDGQYGPGELPTSVFTNLEPFPSQPIGVRISDGTVVLVPGRDFTVQLGFDREVLGIGLDVIGGGDFYEYTLTGFDSSEKQLFDFTGFQSSNFVGWAVERGDLPAFRADVFFDRPPAWDNLAVAEVPESSSGVPIGIMLLGSLVFLKKKLASRPTA